MKETSFLVLLILPSFTYAQGGNTQKTTRDTLKDAAPKVEVVAQRDASDVNKKVFEKVEVQPSFPGGLNGWRAFLVKKLDASALSEDDLEAFGNRQNVRIKFTVCVDGSLCDFEVTNRDKVSQAAATEALRVMKQSPPWVPGKVAGRAVRCFYIQPITFLFME